jgi:Uma2 family endonuclease
MAWLARFRVWLRARVVDSEGQGPSNERRDRVEKMGEYAAFGVRYYWLVDPAPGSVEIFERTPVGHYQKLVGVVSGHIEAVPGCEGLTLDVDALLAELARLGDEDA